MLTRFWFIRSLGISLLNFLNLHGFLRTVHGTLNRSGVLHNRESEAPNLHRDDISQGGFAPLNPLAKGCRPSSGLWGFEPKLLVNGNLHEPLGEIPPSNYKNTGF